MLANYTKLPIKLGILLVGVGLLVAGCDSTSPTAEEGNNEITFEPADGLADRITHVDGNNSSSAAAKTAAPAFELKSHVLPPDAAGDLSGTNGNVRASHLSLSEDPSDAGAERNLYVAYKIRGSEYGGGIDILDAPASSGDNLTEATSTQSDTETNALVVDNVDVQEVAVRHDGGDPLALYVATAVEPDGGFSEAPQFHTINLRGGDGLPRVSSGSVQNESEELFSSSNTTRVAKSVVTAPNNGTYDAFVVSDVNTVHAVEIGANLWGIENVETQEATSGTLFRSVTETSTGTAYALSDGGNLYSFGQLGLSQVTSSSLGSIDSDFSIARLSSHPNPHGSGDLLFVALNEQGFRVFNTSSNEVVYSDTEIYATAVEATSDYVYVANGDGFGLYGIESSGLASTQLDEGLEDIGRASLNDLDGVGSVPGPTSITQVNDILVDDTPSDPIIYVAKSTDGVYKIRQTGGGGVWD